MIATDRFPRRWDGRPGVPVVCLHCKQPYLARTDRKSTFCSSACHHASTRGKGILGLQRFLHQPGDDAKKVRANGLIAKRIKVGHIARPKHCELCGKACRPDACHIDYDLPHVIAFACRSCHMRSHYERDIEADLIAVAKPYGDLPVHPVAKPKVRVVKQRPRRPSRIDGNGLTELQCTQCREWKFVDSFHGLTNPKSKTGRASACRECVAKRNAAKRSAVAS